MFSQDRDNQYGCKVGDVSFANGSTVSKMHENQTPSVLRIDEIETPWTQLDDAHQSQDEDKSQQAQADILNRYGKAIVKYLSSLTKDPTTAADLSQEFVIRFLRGDFKSANRQVGKFRNYLKRSLHNLVIDDFRRRQRRHGLLRDFGRAQVESGCLVADSSPMDDRLDRYWRQEVLRQTWLEFRRENEKAGTPYFEILQARLNYPEDSIRLLAARLNDGKPRSLSVVRQKLSRARSRFRELLWTEVARSCGTFQKEVVEEELCDLGLIKYFRRNLSE